MSGVGRLKFKQNVLLWFVLSLLTDVLISYLLAGLTLNVRPFRLLHTDLGLVGIGGWVWRVSISVDNPRKRGKYRTVCTCGGVCYEEHVDEC